ncbi:hypothetical protein CANARDRAFT_27476 [[Candida] arabinofermentans NRRL YB-2248]|uniref:Uncharacterized protein n=1 Tax=[Candida] arabinofermentans NRRL YB-2248 TaxID=983967 RepID=A0A1E4T3I4_9ASCO|nr:hypothetical protein CANARDRAFT_27476 [[Candida] arabinofermentans NRRL YB-2248]
MSTVDCSLTFIKRTPISTSQSSNSGYLIRNSGLLWNKMKIKAGGSTSYTDGGLNGFGSNNKSKSGSGGNGLAHSVADLSELSSKNKVLKDTGPNGEIFLGFSDAIEVWDWFPAKSERESPSLGESDGNLYLVGSSTFEDYCILKIFPILSDRIHSKYKVLCLVKGTDKDVEFMMLDLNSQTFTILDMPFVQGAKYSAKANDSDRFYIIANNSTGELSVFNKDNNEKIDLQFISKVVNGKSVFDLKGNWLVYNASSSKDPLLNKYLNNLPITPVQLSGQSTLIDKIWKGLSKTAIDSMFILSEISQSKIKKMFAKKQTGNPSEQSPNQQPSSADTSQSKSDDEDEMMKPQNFREIIGKLLNTLNVNSHYLLAFDLSLQQPMFCFSPPEGCSYISLSPYDLLLSTVTTRGDDLYLWDYTLWDKNVVLVDKFKRGKTSSVVDGVVWGEANQSVLMLSKLNGSIHSFSNDSLLDYTESDTFSGTTSTKRGKDVDPNFNWCLSNLGFKKISIINAAGSNDGELITFDDKSNLFMIDTVTGSINWKLELPISASTTLDYAEPDAVEGADDDEADSNEESYESEEETDDVGDRLIEGTNILSQVDIEICRPYPSLYNNRRIHFSKFVDQDIDLGTFGDLPMEYKDVKFGRINGDVKFKNASGDDIPIDLGDLDGEGMVDLVDAMSEMCN